MIIRLMIIDDDQTDDHQSYMYGEGHAWMVQRVLQCMVQKKGATAQGSLLAWYQLTHH